MKPARAPRRPAPPAPRRELPPIVVRLPPPTPEETARAGRILADWLRRAEGVR